MTHRIFIAECGGQWQDAAGRIMQINDCDSIPELRAIAADRDMQVTVRTAAQCRIRKLGSALSPKAPSVPSAL